MKSESLQDHLLKIRDLREQWNSIEWKMEEDMVVITIKCLPTSFEDFIETWNITSIDVDLKLED